MRKLRQEPIIMFHEKIFKTWGDSRIPPEPNAASSLLGPCHHGRGHQAQPSGWETGGQALSDRKPVPLMQEESYFWF